MRCLILLAAGLLCGCSVVDSKHPLSDATDSENDPKLIGKWMPLDEEGEPGTTSDIITVGNHPDTASMLRISKEEHAGIAYSKSLGKDRYLSLEKKPDDGNPGWTIVRYEFPDDELLNLYILDAERVIPFVRSKAVKGVITKNEDDKEEGVLLTDTTANLQTFFTAHGRECFEPEPLVCRRMAQRKPKTTEKIKPEPKTSEAANP